MWVGSKSMLVLKIVESLATFPELANQFFNNVEDYRNTIFLNSDSTAFAYIACIKLSIRSFSGLFAQKIDTENDLSSCSVSN